MYSVTTTFLNLDGQPEQVYHRLFHVNQALAYVAAETTWARTVRVVCPELAVDVKGPAA